MSRSAKAQRRDALPDNVVASDQVLVQTGSVAASEAHGLLDAFERHLVALRKQIADLEAAVKALAKERDETVDAFNRTERELDEVRDELKAEKQESKDRAAAYDALADACFTLLDQLDNPGHATNTMPLFPMREALRALDDPRANKVAWHLD
jgi:septal ring factor EnvC (AmiA/AmiB activator)